MPQINLPPSGILPGRLPTSFAVIIVLVLLNGIALFLHSSNAGAHFDDIYVRIFELQDRVHHLEHASEPPSHFARRDDGGSLADMPDPGKIDGPAKGPGGPWQFGEYTYQCGQMSTGMRADLRNGIHSLYSSKFAMSHLGPKGISDSECNRAFGWATSGIYVCNELRDDNRIIKAEDVALLADSLLRLCCDLSGGYSGQIWHPTANWTVIMGYANNNDPANTVPWKYGANGLGNNPECVGSDGAGGVDGGKGKGSPF